MFRSRVIVALAMGATVASCGGDADPKAFARDASSACREMEQDIAAIGVDLEYTGATEALERELKRLEELEPPEAAAADYERMLEHKRAGLEAWREFAAHAREGESKAGGPAATRANVSLVRAAKIAGQLGIKDCDSALS
jgi:hypothetical protein